MKKVLAISLTVLFVAALAAFAGDKETKYNTGTTSAAITFAPGAGKTVISHLEAASDLVDSAVKFYSGNTFKTVTALTGATNCAIALASSTFTASDKVVYVYANGTAPEYRTVDGSPSTTAVMLTPALTSYAQASAKDRLYLVTQCGQILVGKYGTGVGTNDTVSVSGDVYASPGSAPIYMVITGTSNAVIQATADK